MGQKAPYERHNKYAISSQRSEAIQTAKELGYANRYILQLETAKTAIQISQILASARRAKWG
jgi:hypothetical protein